MASRKQCVIDIIALDTNCPSAIMESKTNSLKKALRLSPDSGIIFIKKDYDYNSEKISPVLENRIWTFDVVLISQSETLLDTLFDLIRKRFDAYTSSPTATTTNSVTYDYARVTRGTQDPRKRKYAMNCQVILCEYCQSVVIA